jgi:transcriptional regulator
MCPRRKSDESLELLPGTLEMLILKALSIGSMHGYAVVRRLQQSSAGVLQVEEGSLYPALHRMDRRGWIEAEWGQSELNRRAKFYSLTRAGKRELARQLDSWERLSGAIAQVLEAKAVDGTV